jgi:hypothetical protein
MKAKSKGRKNMCPRKKGDILINGRKRREITCQRGKKKVSLKKT